MIIEIKTEKSVETNSVGLIDTLSYNPGLSKFLFTNGFVFTRLICLLLSSPPIVHWLFRCPFRHCVDMHTHTLFTFDAPS